MTRFEQIERLKLSVYEFQWHLQGSLSLWPVHNLEGEKRYYVCASELEKLLSEAQEMYAHVSRDGSGSQGAAVWIAKPWQDADATHTALLLGVREIEKPETAEGLLREWYEFSSSGMERPANFYQRVRKVLEIK